ncbi:Pancreatic lipase 2, partial [Operophtera brumata]
MAWCVLLLASALALVSDETRYQYVRGPDGTPHLVDLWLKTSDLKEIASEGLLGLTNYNPQRRTVVLMHGWLDNVNADFNTVLVPAFLDAEDLNVIVVDWSAGAGHSLGAHQAGIAGRNLGGSVAYITALDAAWPGWITNDDKFRSTDGVYTEAIHTNVGLLGYIGDLADVDFYPNGGINMPGCNSQDCDHS